MLIVLLSIKLHDMLCVIVNVTSVELLCFKCYLFWNFNINSSLLENSLCEEDKIFHDNFNGFGYGHTETPENNDKEHLVMML